MITVVDYGRGNLRSVVKALEVCGAKVKLTSNSKEIEKAETLVVPGVGAFGDCMASLERLGLTDSIRAHIKAEKKFLGICLGLQILFEASEESPGVSGLGVFKGRVLKFIPKAGDEKVPHMGWNAIHFKNPAHPLWTGIPDGSAVYFVHSYYVAPEAESVSAVTADYAGKFCAGIVDRHSCAVQFHPEKSHDVGLRFLKNFIGWVV